MFQKAWKNGLQAVVADGVHNKAPRDLLRKAQLYVVHGVCNGDVDVPLIYAILGSKNCEHYEKLLGHLKDLIVILGMN